VTRSLAGDVGVGGDLGADRGTALSRMAGDQQCARRDDPDERTPNSS